ncbi:hypothetical protein ACH79_08345 [Bradyrhizobium sp. CCBAU 051011]|nr:hypothetical protein ACH79_08345 [Bradyrhizobium sp. CCBAU 051011]
MLVSFSFDIPFHKMLGQLLPHTLQLGAIGEGPINIQRAVNWQYVHRIPLGYLGIQVTGCSIVPKIDA